jgi:hypothetical protein
MPDTCPACGAGLPSGTTCDELFGRFLEKDYVDPGYGAVHFLTVGVFMIQHGRYSDEALAWIQPLIRDFLDGKATQEQIRRASQRQVDQSRRAWKVTRRPGAPPAPRLAWTMTIADVARQARDAASYQTAIKAWARATLSQLETL